MIPVISAVLGLRHVSVRPRPSASMRRPVGRPASRGVRLPSRSRREARSRSGMDVRPDARTCAGVRGRARRAGRLGRLAPPRRPRDSRTSSAGARPRWTFATGTPPSTPSCSAQARPWSSWPRPRSAGSWPTPPTPWTSSTTTCASRPTCSRPPTPPTSSDCSSSAPRASTPSSRPQPIPESALLTGPLEPTNDAYAIAKIAGIIAIKSYRAQYGRHWISAMPTNLYGPGRQLRPARRPTCCPR